MFAPARRWGFDSRDEPLTLDHVIASGALPPAFPAVRIGGDPYWDGGIYSNTPIEAVLDELDRLLGLLERAGFDAGIDPNQVFSQWISILPTDQIVATEYEPTDLELP